MRVLMAMSGGVDSSVAAALLRDEGHDVVGVTLKLWGGPSDQGCCSVSDVEDARRVADRLGLDHHVFNFGHEFTEHVVGPYVEAHAAGRTPNPCIECNRHLKFDRLVQRADALGFDAIATGHHARVVTMPDGSRRIGRGADTAKDQSYVLHMLSPSLLERVLLPLGSMTKAHVREIAAGLGLRTAGKPDSQEVCFSAGTGGRRAFLRDRLDLHAADIVDTEGNVVGATDAVELVTIGQRRGLGLGGQAEGRYVTQVDISARRVVVGPQADLLTDRVEVPDLTWVAELVPGLLEAQTRAHGRTHPARVEGTTVHFPDPAPKVAPGQSVVLYKSDLVVASGTA